MAGSNDFTENSLARVCDFVNHVCKLLFLTFVPLHVSHSGSLGKCVKKWCFPFSALMGEVPDEVVLEDLLLSLPEDVDLGST